MIRLIFRIGFALFIAALIFAAFTNPTQADFNNEVETRLQQEFDEHLDNPLLAMAAQESKSFAVDLAEKMTNRDNYFVCSIFTLQTPKGDYRFLGAFNHFVPLQSEDPLDDVFEK
ncbi:MAG: DUF4359 domain-containing protein [Flavobacteriales bacterium]|jgi:hypothetical protein